MYHAICFSDVCQVSEVLRRRDAPGEAHESAAEERRLWLRLWRPFEHRHGPAATEDHRLATAMQERYFRRSARSRTQHPGVLPARR